VSIVIVNFNAGDLICNCIASIIRETTTSDYEIIVVDNDSSDDSVDKIKQQFPSVHLIETGLNAGFAAGNNVGFKAATGDYVLVLNPDTEIINAAIDQTIIYMDNNSDVGALGCKVLGDDNEHQPSLLRFPTLLSIFINTFIPYSLMLKLNCLDRFHYDKIDLNSAQDVEVIVGCFMLVPRIVIQEVGGMDDDFFMFCEEVEWCWRITQAGKKIHYTPDNTIMHYEGGCSSLLSFRKTLLMTKGTLIFFKKTQGAVTAVIANLLMIFREMSRVCIGVLYKVIRPEKERETQFLKRSWINLIYLAQHLIGIEKKI
ncbi:MAG: glycosyltransferase family 2 protein, partial [Methylococcales bacterium]|nr:glycosyltransferase family 2 protein [Methylococcales bacterium]